MGKRSGLMMHHQVDLNAQTVAVELTTRQFDIDTCCIALARMKDKWGYKRVKAFMELWDSVRVEYKPCINASNQMCDIKQRDMDIEILNITKDESLMKPFNERYPYVAPINYNKKFKEKKHRR